MSESESVSVSESASAFEDMGTAGWERDVEIEKHSKARVDSSTDQVRAEIEAKEIKSLLYPPQIAGDKVP